MPSRAAYSFIRLAKVSSLPARCSASAIDASLPDCTTMPRSSTSSGTRDFTCRKDVLPSVPAPPRRQAFSLMKTGSSSLTFPAASSAATM